MKRPLLAVTIGYIIGIVWGLYCKCSIALLYAIITIFYLLQRLIYKPRNKLKLFSVKRYFRYIKIFLKFSSITVFILSSLISNIIIINQNQKYNNLYLNISDVTITGIIVSNVSKKENLYSYKLKVINLNQSSKFKNTNLLLQSKNRLEIEYGDKVIITGNFIEPNIQRNYNGFDYKEYLKTKKIYGTVKVTKAKVIEKNCNNFLLMYSNKIFLKIKNNIEKNLPKELNNLILGIMLGYTENLDDDIRQDFVNSNMAHILAVSGMHISYITLCLNVFLKPVFRKKK